MRYLIPYLISFVMILAPIACGEKIEPGTTKREPQLAIKVSVETAQLTEQPRTYEAVGTVKAGIRSNLGSKLLGTVKDIRVREGDQVKQGDLLVVIDQRRVNARLRETEAGLSEARKGLSAANSALKAARAEQKVALTTYDRYLNLKNEESVSDQEFDEVEARYRQANASLERAKAMVEASAARVKQAEAAMAVARVGSRDALVKAPHNGIITEKRVDKGDLVRPGSPLLVLETTRGFCVDIVLPETYIQYIRSGQKVQVEIPALKTHTFEGNVCTIVPGADPRSRSFIVKITLPVDIEVRSGMFARVKVPTGRSRKLLIPGKAVITRGQLTGLYLLDSQKRVHFRLVRLGKLFGDQIEVLSGLQAGDRYVERPNPALKDDVRVELIP